MQTSDALYRAIVANPEDDTARLVYADWLQENDRPEEAELIRVQCRLESELPDHPDYTDWLAREEELKLRLAANSPQPVRRFPAGLMVASGKKWWTSTRRGFARFLEFDGYSRSGLKPMRELAAAVEHAFAVLPTRWLVVRLVTVAQLAELLRHPVAKRLEHLTIQLGVDEGGGDEAARVVADCPRLRNLRGALLDFPVGEAGAAALAASANLGRMEWLSLDSTVTAAAVRSLGGAAWVRNLARLEFDGYWPDPSFEEFCRLEPFPRLHTLELPGSTFPVAAWQGFARSKTFPALRHLGLGNNMLTDGRAAALAGAAWLRPAHLDLTNCAMGNAGAEALAAAPWLGSLRRLVLFGNLLTARGVAALARSPKLTELKYLSLSNNKPGPLGLRAVAGNPALRGLTTLLLNSGSERDRSLTPSHFQDFLAKLDMPKLRHLSLSRQPVGSRAARLLADEKFRSLTRLELAGCKLTDAVVAALVAAPALQNLIELNLGENSLRDGLKPLADPSTLPRLSWCRVNADQLDPKLKKSLDRRRVLA
jgi:uncharacterized protein (TIGR02996 family)